MTGAYVQVRPTQETINKLRKVLKGVDLPLYPNSELHCTVIYSPESAPESGFTPDRADAFLEDGPFMGRPLYPEVWDSNSGGKILVLRLRSSDLTERHIFWKQQGLLHSFPQYNPHITLTETMTNKAQLASLPGYCSLITAMLPFDEELVFKREEFEIPNPSKRLAAMKRPSDVVMAKADFPKVPKLVKLDKLPPPPVTVNDLDEEEEESMRKYGFNLHAGKRLARSLK